MPVRTVNLPIGGLDDHDAVSIDELYCPNLRNVRSDRARIQTGPGGTLLAPAPTDAAATGAIVSGVITSPLVTGPVTYAHGLGVAPKAFMFQVAGVTKLGDVEKSVILGIGFSDGTTAIAKSHGIVDGSSTPTSGNGPSTTRCILLSTPDGVTTILAGVVTASDASTFTVNWTAVGAIPYSVAYTLIGGSGVQAKIVIWNADLATGNQAVTGVGFTPQIVMHLGLALTPFAFGAMTPSAQFLVDSHSINVGAAPTVTQRTNRMDVAIGNLTGDVPLAPQLDWSAKYVSMDVDGFTVNINNAPQAAKQVGSLCLVGLAAASIGSFNRTTASAPVLQSVVGVGFQADWLLLSGTRTTDNGSYLGDFRSFGTGTAAAQASFGEMAQDGVNPSVAAMDYHTDAIFTRVSNARAEVVLGVLKSLDSDGFTINWTTNDSHDERVIFIALLGAGSTIGVIRNYADLLVGGLTPAESIVMLTSKSAWTYGVTSPSTGIWNPTGELYTGTPIQRFSIANGTDASGALAAWSQGKNNIRKWDGTAFTALITSGTNHAARVVLPFNNRIVTVRPFFGGIDHKTQIRWSVNGNFSDFAGTGSGVLEVVETTNQPLTGGFVLGKHCYLSRGREIIELLATGSLSPVFIPEPVVSGVGFIATHSIATGDIYAFGLGPDEVYQWDGSQMKAVGGRMYNTITSFVDYNNLDQIQATVYEPDSQYWLVVPPYIFIYDYRRDIWDWDDARAFEAIGRLTVQDLFTADIDHSEFVVIGDDSVQTIREDPSVNTYLGSPIDAYFESKDFLPIGQVGRQFDMAYDKYNSVWRVWFRGTPGELVEVGVSTDKGLTYPNLEVVTVNAAGVGISFWDIPFGVLRVRLRSQSGSVFMIQGPIQYEWTTTGVMLPP